MKKSELEKQLQEKSDEAEMWRLERNELEQRMFSAWKERDALRAALELFVSITQRDATGAILIRVEPETVLKAKQALGK